MPKWTQRNDMGWIMNEDGHEDKYKRYKVKLVCTTSNQIFVVFLFCFVKNIKKQDCCALMSQSGSDAGADTTVD